MIKVEIGDYVKDINDVTGYVDYAEDGFFSYVIKESICSRVTHVCTHNNDYKYLKKNFKRIGSHDFTMEENKIKPIKYDGETMYADNSTFNMPRNIGKTIITLMDKINEIIEYISKEER